MSEETIAAIGKDDNDNEVSAEVTFDFGDNLDAAVEKFGADAVFTKFKAASRVDLQALIRRNISGKEPKEGKELQALVDEWSPGATRVRKTKAEKTAELFGELSEDEKKALLKQLKAS